MSSAPLPPKTSRQRGPDDRKILGSATDTGEQPERPAEAATSPGSRVQMADIARLAGVSASTVSRALAGSPLVNAATRERISELARSLNYSINVGAQNLRLKQNRTVAVIVPLDPQTRQPLSDPFFLSLIGALADALTERGLDMLLTRVDADRLDLAANLHNAGRAAAIVLVGQWHHHDQLNEMAVRGTPFVVWGAHLPGQLYPTVGSDNLRGGRLATHHLLSAGARRVLFMGDPTLPEVAQRLQGWRDAHAELGRPIDEALVCPAPFERAGIEAAIDEILARRMDFDACFCAGDLMAMTAMMALRRQGLRVPEDVRVVGYDDIELAAHAHPPLTTVRQPMAEAGAALVETLQALLRGEKVAAVELPTELVVRESSGGS